MSEERKPTKWESRGMSEQEYNLREIRGDWNSPIEQLLPTVPDKKLNPFGRVHDYISVSRPISDIDDSYLSVSDGTTELLLDALIIEPASNFEKPHRIRNSSGTASMMLTNKQMTKVLTEYIRYFGHQWEEKGES